MNSKRYTAGDVERILRMDRQQLHYCVKTLGLIKPVEAKSKITLYDFRNLLDLMLIKILLSLGVTQRGTKLVLQGHPIIVKEPVQYVTIWDDFKQHRRSFERIGYLLVITLQNNGTTVWFNVAIRDMAVMYPMKPYDYKQENQSSRAYIFPGGGRIVVDIRDLVHFIEYKTGEKLE